MSKPRPVRFYQGYKGPGMCGNCGCCEPNNNPNITDKRCSYYNKACRIVCRNCPGIRILKTIDNAISNNKGI